MRNIRCNHGDILISRCNTCPKTSAGLCFSEKFNTATLCERFASGETSLGPLLRGEIELTPVAPKNGKTSKKFRAIPELNQINTCPYRECNTGCQKSRCYARLRGIRWRDEPFTEVLLSECAECIRSMVAGTTPDRSPEPASLPQ